MGQGGRGTGRWMFFIQQEPRASASMTFSSLFLDSYFAAFVLHQLLFCAEEFPMRRRGATTLKRKGETKGFIDWRLAPCESTNLFYLEGVILLGEIVS